MAIEIVDLPMKNGDFPVRHVSLPEGIIPRIHWIHNPWAPWSHNRSPELGGP